jgi:hypothetical protein
LDDARFDAWTRRRFGFTTSGLLATLIGLAAVDDVQAKHKHKHKKCKKNEKRCGKKCVKGNCCLGKPCGDQCECRRTIGGATFCVALTIKTACLQCASDADCEAPFRCVQADGCVPDATANCQPPCGIMA